MKKYLMPTIFISVLSGFLLMLNKKLFIKKGYVSVKGSAEKSVIADMAYWTITFVNTSNNLQQLKQKKDQDLSHIKQFLTDNQFTEQEYKVEPLSLVDLDSREYKSDNMSYRYIMTQSVSIITDKVDLVETASQKLDYLIEKNISLKSEYDAMKPVYQYTRINDIKQDLIKEATLNAKKSAEQFAIDSNSRIDNIKYANQGVITVNPKNKSVLSGELYEKEKQVRAVVSIEYWLK